MLKIKQAANLINGEQRKGKKEKKSVNYSNFQLCMWSYCASSIMYEYWQKQPLLIENWRKSRKCISQLINNESCSQGRGSTKSKCIWNINWTGQPHCKGPEPDAPLSDFEHTINYLRCLQYCMQTWATRLTGRCTSAQILDAGAEATWPAGPACIRIYLLASSYTSAPWVAVLGVGLIGCS